MLSDCTTLTDKNKTKLADIFFILILVIVIGLFGELFYLVYLPLKNRLKKSGKLTEKLNQQINWTFIL